MTSRQVLKSLEQASKKMSGSPIRTFFLRGVKVLILVIYPPLMLHAERPLPPVTIGAVYSLTGYGAIAGQSEANAVSMAVAEINKGGGIAGRELQVVVEDNRSDLNGTVSAFRKLVSANGVPVILGPNWSEFGEVLAPLAQKEKVVMLSASSYTDDLTRGRDFVFTTLPRFEYQVRPLSDLVVKAGHKRIVLLIAPNAYFAGISKAFLRLLKQRGVSIWQEIAFTTPGTDYRTVISKLKHDGVDAVVVFLAEGGESATFFRQARELQYGGVLYANDISYDQAILQRLAVAEGVKFFRYVAEAPQEFLQRYRTRFGVDPTVNVPLAYDNVFILKEAMEKCGFTPPQLRECLTKTEYTGVSGEIRFGRDNNLHTERSLTKIFEVRGGEFHQLG